MEKRAAAGRVLPGGLEQAKSGKRGATAADLNKLFHGMDAKLQRIERLIAKTERTLARK